MIRWISDMWLGSPAAEFESSFGLEESVERLRTATRRSAFSVLARQEAVGKVSESLVSLQRVIPMVRNSFKPFFRGRFVERNGKIFLTGRFGMNWFAKIFMTIWFGMLTCFVVSGSLLTGFHARNAMPLALAGVGMMAFGVGLVFLCKWFSRNDPVWLSQVIRNALGPQAAAESAHAGIATPGAFSSSEPAPVITLMTLGLALLGVICIGGAILGVQSAHAGPDGLKVAYFSNQIFRFVSAAYGIALLVLAAGVYRRRMIAWRAGIGLLAVGWLYPAAQFLLGNHAKFDYPGAVFFCTAGLFVTILWIRWWYAQRIYFQE